MNNGVLRIHKIKFTYFKESNGILLPIEGKNQTPFSIKRVYYIFNVKKNDIRGDHAHKKCQQMIICVKGECKIKCDDGKHKKTFMLNKPYLGLYLPPMIWSKQIFTKRNSILLILADKKYQESDYIRSYNIFKKLI